MLTGRDRLRSLRTHLDGHLFLPTPAARGSIGRGEYLVVVGAMLVLAIVLELARPGFTGSIETLWAEDGTVFLNGALTQSFWHAITSTYANYLVVTPRLIGEAASLLPLQDAAAVFAIISASIVALSGLIVWLASAGLIENPYLRGTLALLTALTPVAALESLDSASYVSWYMLFATFWILLWRPKSMRTASLASLFVLATALSNPGVWFFAPLAALRAIAVHDRRDVAIVTSFAVGAALQIPTLLSQEPVVPPQWTGDILTAYMQRVVVGAPLGLSLGGDAWSHLGWPLLIGLALAGLAGLFMGARRANPGARYLAVIAVLTSLVMFLLSLYQRAAGPVIVWAEGLSNGLGGRYSIVPSLLLVSAAIVLLDNAWRRRPEPRPKLHWPSLAAVLLLLTAVATSFDARDYTARGKPSWSMDLHRAAMACTAERVATATIYTSPPGFGFKLPCARISSFADPKSTTGVR
jgi:hypothetical protein